MGPNQRGLIMAIRAGEDNTLLTGDTLGTIYVDDIKAHNVSLSEALSRTQAAISHPSLSSTAETSSLAAQGAKFASGTWT